MNRRSAKRGKPGKGRPACPARTGFPSDGAFSSPRTVARRPVFFPEETKPAVSPGFPARGDAERKAATVPAFPRLVCSSGAAWGNPAGKSFLRKAALRAASRFPPSRGRRFHAWAPAVRAEPGGGVVPAFFGGEAPPAIPAEEAAPSGPAGGRGAESPSLPRWGRWFFPRPAGRRLFAPGPAVPGWGIRAGKAAPRAAPAARMGGGETAFGPAVPMAGKSCIRGRGGAARGAPNPGATAAPKAAGATAAPAGRPAGAGRAGATEVAAWVWVSVWGGAPGRGDRQPASGRPGIPAVPG